MGYLKLAALILIALVAFRVALYFAADATGESGGDEQSRNGLRIEPATVNLGDVILDRPTNFTAAMRNNGRQPIRIANIKRSCGCIQAVPVKETCQPGETVQLNGTLVPNKTGRFRYYLELVEEDKSAPEHRLEVVGKASTAGGPAAEAGGTAP